MFTLIRVPIIAIIIAFVEISIGLVGNGFIVVINGMDWIKTRKLSSCDMILTYLGISRIILHGAAVMIYSYLFFLTETSILDSLFITFRIIHMCAGITSSWFASCLSVFYCVKIASFTQPLFLRMKQRISGIVPQLLLGSLLLALLTSIPSVWANYDVYLCNSTRKLLENTTDEPDVNLEVSYLYFILLVTVKDFFPFIVFLVSSILLITSLWKHTRHMQHNAASFLDPRTEVHVNAIKVLFSCLLLYVCSIVADTLRMFPACLTDRTWTPGISSIVVPLYPAVHSIILILINPKLKQASVKILQCQIVLKITNLLNIVTRH